MFLILMRVISFKKTISILFFFIISIILLYPESFGQSISNESFKVWGYSKFLLEFNNFVDFRSGILSYLILILFTPFSFKTAILLEYFLGTIFFLFCFYNLLKSYDLKILKYILPILFIPIIYKIEGSNKLLGISFLFLHFSLLNNKSYCKNWVPTFLLCSILCNWGYIFFLLGHIFGKFFTTENKKIYFDKFLIINFFLVLLVLISITLKGNQKFNNHWLERSTYYPYDLKSGFGTFLFQAGNYLYVQRNKNISKDKPEGDWFFTNKVAFKNCNNTNCVLTKSLDTIFDNFVFYNFFSSPVILSEVIYGPIINKLEPSFSNIKIDLFIFIFILCVTILFIFTGLHNIFYKKKFDLFFSIIFGVSAYIFAMLISMVTIRYSYSLLPVFILLFCNLKNGLYLFQNNLFSNKATFLKPFNYALILIFISHFLYNLELFYKRIYEKKYLPITSKAINTEDNVNLLNSYEQIINEVKNKKKILTYEAVWLYAFSDIKREKIFSTNNLPPYKDETKKIKLFLDEFDTILVSNQFLNDSGGMAMSVNLRYRLHLDDYFRKNIDKFYISKVKDYGFVYHRKN